MFRPLSLKHNISEHQWKVIINAYEEKKEDKEAAKEAAYNKYLQFAGSSTLTSTNSALWTKEEFNENLSLRQQLNADRKGQEHKGPQAR